MQEGRMVLAIISERGKKGLPLERVYRHLFNRDLYLMAYGKIYRNAGALTPGSTSETVDDMSLRKIDAIIEAVRYERYRWTPTRRVYIEKKNSTTKNAGGLLAVPYEYSTWTTTQRRQEQKHGVTGEPDTWKLVSPVRRGGVEKGHFVYLVGVLLYPHGARGAAGRLP